jgi:two-component system sensor histidine kinase KdpD
MRLHLRRIALSACLIGAVTLVVAALRPLAPDISLGALYTIAVLAAAVWWGLAYAIGVSIASLLVFNWLFLPPVHTFELEDTRNWTALVVYLVVAVVTSELASRARRRAREAERRERDAALLADLAARLLERGRLDDLELPKDRDDAAADRLRQAVLALHALAAERERLEREAVDAEALRQTDAVKTAVIRSVSHDLRTPLATLESALDGIDAELGRGEPVRRELVEAARRELGRLERYVENLLDLSRLQAGAARPAPQLWTVDALIAQALDEVEDDGRVVVEPMESLPPVQTDLPQIQRTLVNLLENALRYSPPGSPVSVAAEVVDHEVHIRIADDGPGIAEDEATRIFEPFHHGPSGGAGLGLAIARGFAEATGGRLWLDAGMANGASFVVALPVGPSPEENA